MILFACLLFCIKSEAQFEKKVLRNLEKMAVFLPVDTLIISTNSIVVGSNLDSLFGKTVVNGQPGWSQYGVNLDGAYHPVMLTEGSGFSYQIPPYIQHKVGGVYICQTEVSNKAYQDFVTWTHENHPEQVPSVLLDSQNWNSVGFRNSPMMDYYHHHPAFENYPLSNVSHQQAKLYLEWLTNQYNSSPARKYKKVVFRLPTEVEWMYAYLGNTSEYGATYGGNFRRPDGKITANFILYSPVTQILLQDSAYVQSSDPALQVSWSWSAFTTNKKDTFNTYRTFKPKILTFSSAGFEGSGNMDYTTPVKSYWPNGFDIYNMAGNVAEFVAEEGIVKGGHWNTTGFYLKPTSRETFLDEPSASPTRGFRWVMEVIEE